MKVRIKETGNCADVFFDYEKSKECNTPIWAGVIGEKLVRFNEHEIEFISYIDWKQVRVDIAMRLIDKTDVSVNYINFEKLIFDKANSLTQKLMEDMG